MRTSEKWGFEIPDEPIAEADIAETIEAEIVVVGAGTGGLAAANAAVEEGANVVLLSASSKPISRAAQTMPHTRRRWRLRAFRAMTLRFMKKELQANGARVDARKWYKFFNHSEEVMNWLIDIMEGRGYTTGIESSIPTLDNESGSIFYLPARTVGTTMSTPAWA